MHSISISSQIRGGKSLSEQRTKAESSPSLYPRDIVSTTITRLWRTNRINVDNEHRMPGWLRSTFGFGSAHDFVVCWFKPHVRLCADSPEPGACFRFWVSLSLPLPHSHSVSLSLSLSVKNKHFFNVMNAICLIDFLAYRRHLNIGVRKRWSTP